MESRAEVAERESEKLRKELEQAKRTPWLKAQAANDFIVKIKVTDLKPATRYFYRAVYGPNKSNAKGGPVGSFSTLQGATGDKEVSFVVVTGMNYMSFHYGKLGGKDPKTNFRTRNLATSYQGKDKALGFPALETIRKLKPTFFVGRCIHISRAAAGECRRGRERRSQPAKDQACPAAVAVREAAPVIAAEDLPDEERRAEQAAVKTQVPLAHAEVGSQQETMAWDVAALRAPWQLLHCAAGGGRCPCRSGSPTRRRARPRRGSRTARRASTTATTRSGSRSSTASPSCVAVSIHSDRSLYHYFFM